MGGKSAVDFVKLSSLGRNVVSLDNWSVPNAICSRHFFFIRKDSFMISTFLRCQSTMTLEPVDQFSWNLAWTSCLLYTVNGSCVHFCNVIIRSTTWCRSVEILYDNRSVKNMWLLIRLSVLLFFLFLFSFPTRLLDKIFYKFFMCR
jgi:hypothetical protein